MSYSNGSCPSFQSRLTSGTPQCSEYNQQSCSPTPQKCGCAPGTQSSCSCSEEPSKVASFAQGYGHGEPLNCCQLGSFPQPRPPCRYPPAPAAPIRARLCQNFTPPTCIQNGCGPPIAKGKSPSERLRNVDVLEELCYYVPGQDPCCSPMQCYNVCNCCGSSDLVNCGCCPCPDQPNPVKYSRRQRFTFQGNEAKKNDFRNGPKWPFVEHSPCPPPPCRDPCQEVCQDRCDSRSDRSDRSDRSRRHKKHQSPTKCEKILPNQSGVYYFNSTRRMFIPQKDMPKAPEVIIQQPPPPPPAEQQQRSIPQMPMVEEYEILEDRPPKKQKEKKQAEVVVQPVIQPVIMSNPCNPCGNNNPCCNPCGNSHPCCNPCMNQCNPCGNPCNPCGNPCNPCGNPCFNPMSQQMGGNCNPFGNMCNPCNPCLPMCIPMCNPCPPPAPPPPPPPMYPPMFPGMFPGMFSKQKDKKKKKKKKKRRHKEEESDEDYGGSGGGRKFDDEEYSGGRKFDEEYSGGRKIDEEYSGGRKLDDEYSGGRKDTKTNNKQNSSNGNQHPSSLVSRNIIVPGGPANLAPHGYSPARSQVYTETLNSHMQIAPGPKQGGFGHNHQHQHKTTGEDGSVVTTIDFPRGEAENVIVNTQRARTSETNIHIEADLGGHQPTRGQALHGMSPVKVEHAANGTEVTTYVIPAGEDASVLAYDKAGINHSPQHHQAPHHQSPHHQSPHHQSPHHQSPHHQAPHHQSPHHQSPHHHGSPKDAKI